MIKITSLITRFSLTFSFFSKVDRTISKTAFYFSLKSVLDQGLIHYYCVYVTIKNFTPCLTKVASKYEKAQILKGRWILLGSSPHHSQTIFAICLNAMNQKQNSSGKAPLRRESELVKEGQKVSHLGLQLGALRFFLAHSFFYKNLVFN